MSQKTPFWSSVPGILTALAGILAGIAAIIAAVVNLLPLLGLGGSDEGATDQRRSSVSASIAAPRQADKVCFRQDVSGTAKGLPESSELWLVVYTPDIERYFPVGRAARVIRRGKTRWSGVAYMGGSPRREVGDAFELQIVGATQSADRSLDEYEKGPAIELGLPSLPSGTERLDKVFVTRAAC